MTTRHGRLRTKQELGLPKWMAAVEGSVEDPPIVLRTDRLKFALAGLAWLVLLGLVLLIPVRTYTSPHLIVLGVLCACIVVCGFGACFQPTLILDPAGLTWRTGLRTVEYPWSAFAGFRWYRRRDLVAVVVGDFAPVRPPAGWRRLLSGPLVLGGFWELPAARVVEVLNEALKRWRPREVASAA
ncbi:PH domain-containing protein [uncultured Reyranella sp.]|uniref:PH domain-containing protein n=1 Tax=uncultured Reyranella sp. TaxID=735512 RepID=UPI00259CB83B|nr:PH domain-containing protein [uncultured Reyranella sp.]